MCGLRHFSQWKGLKDHLLSALRGAPPCTPANRCSETQSQRIRPCLFVERTKLRNFCPILRTVWILDLRAHEDKVSHTPSSQNAHGHATAEACKRAGVPLIKGQPCPCCRKTVHDKNGHAAQCAVLFQILFYDLVHGLKHTNKHLLDAHFRVVPRPEVPTHGRLNLNASTAASQAPSGDTGGTCYTNHAPFFIRLTTAM